MTRGFVGLLILLTAAGPVPTVVEQTTSGWCSPAQAGTGNQVICNGIDPRAMARLNELLDLKDLSLKQKTAEADEWARKYRELDAQFEETKNELAATGGNLTLVQTAQDRLHQGKLEEAREIYDRLIASDESNVDRAAQDYFNRATIFALQFRMSEAMRDYATAYQYRPDNPRYADDYADALWSEKDYPKAETVLRKLLPQQRVLAAQKPAAYRPDLANTLNHLGNVYFDTRRFAEAEAAFKEALGIRRELAAQNPAYRDDLADALNNLGNVYNETQRFAEAEAALKEAVRIRRELAVQNPAAYRSDVAQTLNNLGALYGTTDRFVEAEEAFKEAVGIWHELAAQNPAAYRPDLASALTNLGTVYGITHRLAEAEAAYQAAVDILLELAAQDPAAYQSELARALFQSQPSC
jgi:tetratricopeptide (TPR) repeat protein